jgi:hypothetical protein
MPPGWAEEAVMSDHREHREQDPAEGANETIDRELKRSGNAELGADEATRRNARKKLEQVKAETELPQKGSA